MRGYLNAWLTTAGLSALSILFLPNAWADAAAQAGATMTVTIQITTKEQSKTDIRTTTINRTLKGQCLMEAQAPTQIGWNGVSAEQQAAVSQSQANADAFVKQYGPSEGLSNQIAAAAEKCGDDEACMMAFVQKLSQNSEIQTMAKNKDAAKAAMPGLTPDLGPARFQLWQPKQCTGTVTANDTFIVDDPGGEGGMDAYKETKKVQGSAATSPDWHGMTIETDAVAGTTTYRMMPIPPVTIASSSSLKGAGQEQVNVIPGTPIPDAIGPLKGILGKQSTTVKGPGGTVSLNWQSVR
ncbi:MAG TPA: hypothetical protein VM639_23350 [Dongiaceae bacterium]|nr:hypothetical protein [Dongiaceae bacterium]